MSNSNSYYLKKYLIAFLAGFLLMLPLTYPSLFFVSWFALIPFLLVVKDFSASRVFISGTVMGISLIFWSSHWLYYPLVEFSGMPYFLAILIFLLVFILYGSIYGFWAVFYYYIRKNKDVNVFFLAITWVAFEYLRYLLFSELPFGYLAYTQVGFLSLVQLAEYGGMFLISFIIILFNGYLFKAIRYKKIRFLLPFFIIIIFILIFGRGQINQYNNKDYQTINVGIIQSNLDPIDKWAVSNIEPNIDYFMSKSQELDGVELIVWPETALTFDLIRNEYFYNKLMDYFPLSESYIQLSGHAIIEDPMERYNSSFLVSPAGDMVNRYNKMRLVPFGEYMPLSNLLKKVGVGFSSQTPGEQANIFIVNDYRWRTVICSEILFPYLVQKEIDEADFIVTQSVESWYKRGNLQKQMWSAAVFRAVENRRSVIKSANMGYGGIISPAGVSVVKEHSMDNYLISNEILLNREETIYQHWGNYPGLGSLLISIIILISKVLVSNRGKKKGFTFLIS